MNDITIEGGLCSDDNMWQGDTGDLSHYEEGGWLGVNKDDNNEMADLSHEGGEYKEAIENIMEDVITASWVLT